MKKPVSSLKQAFKNFQQPTEDDFGDLIDSFVHKDGTIPASQVEGWTDDAAVEIEGTVLPELGNKNKYAELYGGANGRTFTYGDQVFPLDPNTINKLFWDGVEKIWRVSDSAVLPMQEGVDKLKPTGTGLTTEKAVAEYVEPLFNLSELGKNRADKSLIEMKVWSSTGNRSDSEINISLPPIEVPEDVTHVAISGVRNNSSINVRAVWLGNNDSLVSVVMADGATSQVLEKPDGGAKIGVNVAQATGIVDPTDNEWANTVQVEFGSKVTEYTPFQIVVIPSRVPGYGSVKGSVDFWKFPSPNLADPSKIVVGRYYQTNGNIASNAAWSSIILPAKPNTKYSIQKKDSSFFGNEYSEGNPNSGTLIKNIESSGNTATVITTEGTTQIGININGSLEGLMITEGDPTGYIPFGKDYIDATKVYGKLEGDAAPLNLFVEKTLTDIHIHIHQYDEVYIRQSFSRYTRSYVPGVVSFYDVWKLGATWKVIKEGESFTPVYRIIPHNTEWETAFHIDGYHISGQQHGYEQKQSNIFMADGVLFDENYVGNFQCKNLEFVQKSLLYRYDTTTDVVIEKTCRWVIDKTGVLIDLPYCKPTQEIVVTQNAYMGMFAISPTLDGIDLTKTGFNDVSFHLNDLNSLPSDPEITIGAGNNNPDTNTIWKQGEEFSCKFHVLDLVNKFPNHKLYAHTNGKIYNIYTRDNYLWRQDEIFGAKIKVDFSIRKPLQR